VLLLVLGREADPAGACYAVAPAGAALIEAADVFTFMAKTVTVGTRGRRGLDSMDVLFMATREFGGCGTPPTPCGPTKPIRPFVCAEPGYLFSTPGSLTESKSASKIIVLFRRTVMRRPLALPRSTLGSC
jgi:hypothetical protein